MERESQTQSPPLLFEIAHIFFTRPICLQGYHSTAVKKITQPLLTVLDRFVTVTKFNFVAILDQFTSPFIVSLFSPYSTVSTPPQSSPHLVCRRSPKSYSITSTRLDHRFVASSLPILAHRQSTRPSELTSCTDFLNITRPPKVYSTTGFCFARFTKAELGDSPVYSSTRLYSINLVHFIA